MFSSWGFSSECSFSDWLIFICIFWVKRCDSFIFTLFYDIIIVIWCLCLPLFLIFSSEVPKGFFDVFFFQDAFIIVIMLYLCCIFVLQGIFWKNFRRVSLWFTAVKITKTSQEKINFFEADFLFACFEFGSYSFNIRRFLSLGWESSISWNMRHFSEWVIFIFCARKLLPEV